VTHVIWPLTKKGEAMLFDIIAHVIVHAAKKILFPDD
jgi:hypothetical protein